ncbi:MAG: type IX secretion system protein PorQ [Bacteroidales bacterium]|nr:type IX secretion system protein PorQ [Bacteroidales bacterium]MCF8405064.1 type IX secretion system protein PorQ [Bacteroidales bacterium]
MKKIRLPVFILFVVLYLPAISQIGGNNVYQVYNLTPSPRIAAMGGDFLAINDNDVLLAYANPSLINSEMHNHLGASFVNYFASTNYGLATYSRTFNEIGSFAGSVKYISYGEFDGADVAGNRTGSFYAGETAVNLGWGRQLDSSFSIGSNLKFIYASNEGYTSYGLAVDVAGSYTNSDKSFTASLIAKNIGRQLKAFEGGNQEPLPFEIQLGLSKRLKHLPFRYSILLNHLQKWDLSYDSPGTQQVDPISGEVIGKSEFEQIADNFMRHVVFGGELLIGKNISLMAGYNYKRRQEMKIESKTGMVGFSWGLGIKVSKFHISYARSAYHQAGSPNYIAITTNLSDFFITGN